MSRAQTTLNALLAAMFLVSLLPAGQAASDPATPAQEAAIEAVPGVDVPNNVAWQVKNELHNLHLRSDNVLGYSTSGAGTPKQIGGPNSKPAFFNLTKTAAETEITSFAATMFIQTSTATTVTVSLMTYPGGVPTAIENLTINIGGVLVNVPGPTSPAPVGTVSEYTVSKLTSKTIAPDTLFGIRVSVTSSSPAAAVNVVNLHHGGSTDSRVSLIADSARVKAWTEKDLTPGVVQSSFASPQNAPSEERTLKFHFAEVQAFNESAVVAFPLTFQVVGPEGKVHFDSSGSPVGTNAPDAQRWGASSTLPTDAVGLAGVVQKTYRITYPQTLTPGQYNIRLGPSCASGVCPTWSIDIPVNVGASGGAFELAKNPDEASEKTILVGQRTTFRLTLRNSGTIEDTFALQANVGNLQPGWIATIAPAQVKLAPQGTTDVELTVVPAPNGANGQSNTITATATSLISGQSFQLDKTLRVLLTNVRTHGVEILNATNFTTANPEPTLRWTVAPGGQVSLPLFVQNLGNGFDRFVVSLTGAPAGWTASANPGLVELGARSQGATIVKVEAPVNAVPANSFLLTVKASRLDDLTKSDTQLIRVVVADIDLFTFQAFDGSDRANPVRTTSTVAAPVVHRLRDEGMDGSTNDPAQCSDTVLCWDGSPDGDRDYDQSGLFRLVLRNDGSRSDTYTITPYVLTSGTDTARILAGDTTGSRTVRDGLGYQDLDGCDQAGDSGNTVGDNINDGWLFRLIDPTTLTGKPATLAGSVEGFETERGQTLTVTVPARTSQIVYAEMKWIVPNPAAAGEDCTAAANRVQGEETGARAADPATGHAVLIEAVSSRDASHRATHVLNTKVILPEARTGSQRYTNSANDVLITPEAGESVVKRVTTEAGGRTVTYDLRAVNAGNEMDTLRITLPQFSCPSSNAPVSQCWEHSVVRKDERFVLANDAGRTGAGTCTTPAVSNPAATSRAALQIAFECTMGVFDEVAFRVSTTAPASGVIGATDNLRVTVTSKDSFAGTAKFDDVDLSASITGLYALDVITGATSQAPVLAGGSTAIPFTVRNLGTNADNVTLDLRDALGGGWVGDFSLPNPVFIPAGRQVDVLLLATAPAGAAPGLTQKFEVRATSLDSPAISPPVDNVTLEALVRSATTLLTVAGEPQNVLGAPGERETGTIRVTKTSANPDATADLAIDPTSLPQGWTASFSETATQLTKTVAFSAGAATTDVYVTPPATALGTSRAAVRITGHTDGVTDAGDANTFTHLGVSLSTPNLGIEISAPDGNKTLVAPGSATKTRLTVENLGVGQDVIRLTAGTLPTGWNAVFDAGNLTLQPLQSRSTNVTVTAPANLGPGQSRLLTFIATTSDGLRTDSVQVNFTTGESLLGLTTSVVGTLRQLPQEPFSFTVSVNNTGDLPDNLEMRSGLTGTFKDVVKMTFQPSTLELDPGNGADVLVTVTFPAGLAANLDVPLVVEAASVGPFLDSVGAVTVSAKVLDHKVRDVDGDLTPEYAADRDLNPANGYEEFFDPNVGTGASKAVDAASFLSEAAKARFTITTTVDGNTTQVVRFLFDPDQDNRTDLLVDRDADGLPDIYWDPDIGYSHVIPVLKDVTKDGREDYFFDLDGTGGLQLDVFYDPLEGRIGRLIKVDIDNNGVLDYVVDSNGNNQPDLSETVLFGGPEGTIASIRETADVDGDGRPDSVIDSDGDGKPDYFVPNGSNAGVAIVLEDVNGDGIEDWTFDSDGDGRRDAFYDPATQKSGFMDQKGDFFAELTKYWYIGALFAVVLALFVVLLIVTRR